MCGWVDGTGKTRAAASLVRNPRWLFDLLKIPRLTQRVAGIRMYGRRRERNLALGQQRTSGARSVAASLVWQFLSFRLHQSSLHTLVPAFGVGVDWVWAWSDEIDLQIAFQWWDWEKSWEETKDKLDCSLSLLGLAG